MTVTSKFRLIVSELFLIVNLKTPSHGAGSVLWIRFSWQWIQANTRDESEIVFLFYLKQLGVATTKELLWLNMRNWKYDFMWVSFHDSTKMSVKEKSLAVELLKDSGAGDTKYL